MRTQLKRRPAVLKARRPQRAPAHVPTSITIDELKALAPASECTKVRRAPAPLQARDSSGVLAAPKVDPQADITVSIAVENKALAAATIAAAIGFAGWRGSPIEIANDAEALVDWAARAKKRVLPRRIVCIADRYCMFVKRSANPRVAARVVVPGFDRRTIVLTT